jgi:hypothetical protein
MTAAEQAEREYWRERDERAARVESFRRLLVLHVARVMLSPWFWLYIVVAAFLAWLSGYDVR